MKSRDMEIVSTVREELAERLGEERFELWFAGVVFRLQDDALEVSTGDTFSLDRVRNHFRSELESVCEQVAGQPIRVSYRVDSSLVRHDASEAMSNSSPPQDTQQRRRTASAANCIKFPGASPADPATPRTLQRRYATLGEFVACDQNRIAYSSVSTIVKQPGQYSPLFLYGPCGTGKTHLLEGIVSEGRRSRTLRRVVMLSAEQFTSSFLEALRGSGLPNFRRKYRDVDALLIDDIQFFAGKRATIVELQHTVDSLIRDGRQLVLTADRSPAELNGLGAELATRLSGGLVCGLEYPDETARLQIVQRLGRRLGLKLPENVQSLLAERVHGDCRQLLGAVNRLHAVSAATGESISLPSAEESLADIFQATRRVIQLSDIEDAVCEVFGVDGSGLQSQRKSKVLSQPRMLAMWLARKYTRAAFSEIGQYFGRRSHSTVISAQRTVESWMASDTRIQLGHGDCQVQDAIRRLERRLMTG